MRLGRNGGLLSPPTAPVAASAAPQLLEHDFGLVPPDSTHEHVFRVTNTGRERWSLRQIKTGCTCTATKVSADSVAPGEELELTVSYHAPQENSDERRIVRVDFAEPTAARVQLQILATVRAPLSVSARELVFRAGANQKSPLEQVLYAENYSEREWSSLKVQSDKPWLTAAVVPSPAREGRDGIAPRQTHKVILCVHREGLAEGSHTAFVTLAADTASGPCESARLLASLRVEPPMRALPERLFFGQVGLGEIRTKKVRIVFSSPAPDFDRAKLATSCPEEVVLSCQALNSRTWELAAKLTAGHSRSLEGESVTVQFTEPEELSLRIPLGGEVVDGGSDE